jgi:hypothetical protein
MSMFRLPRTASRGWVVMATSGAQAGVHALGPGRGVSVRRVAGQQHPAGPVLRHLPDEAAQPVAAHQVVGALGFPAGQPHPHLVVVLLDPGDLAGPAQGGAQAHGAVQEQGLDLALRDVQQVGKIRIQPAKVNGRALQPERKRRHREAGRGERARLATQVEHFHAPRVQADSTEIGAQPGPPVEYPHLDAGQRQFGRKRQAGRPGADHDHRAGAGHALTCARARGRARTPAAPAGPAQRDLAAARTLVLSSR